MAHQGLQQDFGDLQQRLEHLITYSSQLAFVSGDGMGAQFSFVEGFIAKQNELANICYIKASPRLSAADYRNRLVRQLIGQQLMDTSQPLKDVLPRRLSNDNQFILVLVTQAEQLPDELLKELWDLVLQNRFAKHRHHLNVLLFGEKPWAEKTKAWLHGNSGDQPVLLSTQSLTKDDSDSELERMLADKREAFAKRMQARERSQSSLLSRWWFKWIVGLMLIALSAAVMLVSYFDVREQEFKEFAGFLFQSDLPPSVSEVTETEVGLERLPQQTHSTAATSETETAEPATKQDAVASPPGAEVNAEEPEERTDPIVAATGKDSVDDTARVLDWQAAIQRSRENTAEPTTAAAQEDSGAAGNGAELSRQTPQPETLGSDNSEVIVSPYPETENAQAVVSDNSAEQTTETTEPIGAVDDYPVEDVTSLDDLATSETTPVVNVYEWDGDSLMALDRTDMLLQVAAMSSPSVLAEYLQDNGLNDKVWLYQTQRFGGAWYVVLFNQSYPTSEQARQALPDLIPLLGEQTFIKSAAQIQQELQN